jgi:carboxyl-terminal processing protease
MKKFILLFSFYFTFLAIQAQNPTYQQKLYYTCKIWGFVKYYHSNVSVCGVNWDSVLLHCLPLVLSAVTNNDFNNAMDTMLNAAGPMTLTSSPRPDTMAPELKRNLNFGWLNDPFLRADVQTILDTIKNNFRPHAECWVQNNPNTNSYTGWLVFPHDSLMLNQDTYTNFPDEWHRLLVMCKEWNIINYFNPNNYLHDQSWDSTLFQTVMGIDTASNDYSLYLAFRKMTAQNNDAHTEGLTQNGNQWFPYGYELSLVLRHLPGKYIVVQTGIPAIHVGDELLSVQGLTTKQWEDSLGPYTSAGDSDVFRRCIAQYMLCTPIYNNNISIGYKDSLGNIHSVFANATSLYYSSWFYNYYPNDTLATVNYKYWSNCNVGYVNMGQLQQVDVASMYNALQNTNAIIFDIRNYPNSTEGSIANDMYPALREFAKFQDPDVTYPGTYFWYHDYLGVNGNPTPYLGKVIILFNEETQSQAEFSCMILEGMPNVVKIGSHTAGTDGNVTFYRLSQYVETGFTTLGTFYANGDSTERIGIVPDTLMYPTQLGIRHHRDELLEKALQVADCNLGVPTVTVSGPSLTVYPNPSNGHFVVKSEELRVKGKIEIYNTLGEKIYINQLSAVNSQFSINLTNQPVGLYLYRVMDENGKLIAEGKLVIE